MYEIGLCGMWWPSTPHIEITAALVGLTGGPGSFTPTPPPPSPAACRGHRCILRFCPRFPADTPTHFSSSGGVPKATCIDPIFVKGARSIKDADVFPSPTPHRPLLVSIEPAEGLADIRSWRTIRWRHSPPGTLPRLAALIDLLWGWLASYPVGPKAFHQSLWAAARHLIPHPRPVDLVLRDLRRRAAPRTDAELADLRESWLPPPPAMELNLQMTLCGPPPSPEQPKVPRAAPPTRCAPTAGSSRTWGVNHSSRPSPRSIRPSVSHHQAPRTPPPDLNFLTTTYDPAKWDPYFDPIAHVPAKLLGNLLAAGIDPRDRPCRDLFS